MLEVLHRASGLVPSLIFRTNDELWTIELNGKGKDAFARDNQTIEEVFLAAFEGLESLVNIQQI